MKTKILIYTLLISLTTSNLFSQVFIQDSTISLHGFSNPNIIWNDYNNDGNIDLLIAGFDGDSIKLFLYENYIDTLIEKLLFAEKNYLNITLGCSDFNNDGHNDITFSTFDYMRNNFFRIYINDSLNNQTDTVNLGYGAYSYLHTLDYDNDGDIDILSGIGSVECFKNDGQNKFEHKNLISNSIGDSRSKLEIGDYDNDGDFDLLLYAPDDSNIGFSTKIYTNNFSQGFDYEESIVFESLTNGNVIWIDINNDSYLDIILTGKDLQSNYKTIIYKNNTNGSFSIESNINLNGFIESSINKGDYDNDGDFDILISGKSDSVFNCFIYDNNGNGNFTKNINETFPSLSESSVSFCDINKDGNIDIVYSGIDSSNSRVTMLYKNRITTLNSIPEAPNNTTAIINDSIVTITWNIPNDANQTSGLTYNLYIYNFDIDTNFLKSENNKFIYKIENIQTNSYSIKLPDGRYKYCVRAIDASFAHGMLSIEKEFIIGEGNSSLNSFNDYFKIYPTITKDLVYIYGQEESIFNIDIYTISGEKILSDKTFIKNGIIDFKNYKNGMYIIKIKNNNLNYYYKLIKE